MNFFGHATVACQQRDHPRFVLGAMLPDFAGMASVRLERALDAELAEGVALHHETDRLFHALPGFRAVCASALATLEPQGVRRASARAVGHVGSELLLDGLLAADAGARRAYAHALVTALEEPLDRLASWHTGDAAKRVQGLIARLHASPLPQAYRDPEFVCDRLYWILARRPRLSLQASDRSPVLTWLDWAAAQLEREADSILTALR
jgi:hypothetical protein